MSDVVRVEGICQHKVDGRYPTSGDEGRFVADEVIVMQSDGVIQRPVITRISKERKRKKGNERQRRMLCLSSWYRPI